MQPVQLFEPDMCQVLYMLGHWQLLVDFTLMYVKVLPCDICLEVSVTAFIKNNTYKEDDCKGNISVDFQHCLGKDWNSFE